MQRAAFDNYEPRTVHESSLSYGPHAVVTAYLGKTQISADFLQFRGRRLRISLLGEDELEVRQGDRQ